MASDMKTEEDIRKDSNEVLLDGLVWCGVFMMSKYEEDRKKGHDMAEMIKAELLRRMAQ